MKRILVPVDFSDFSRAALDWAIQLAARCDAAVDVIHVAAAPPYAREGLAVRLGEGRDAMSLGALARGDAEERLEMFLEKVGVPAAGVTMTTRIDFGDPLDRILENAAKHDAIVLGTHGRTGVTHFVLGSVAEKVLRHAKVPVFTVRGHNAPLARPASGARASDRKPLLSRILVAVDFSPCSRRAMELAADLAGRFQASVDVVHAVTRVPVEGADLLVVSFSRESNTPFKEWAKSAARSEMERFLAARPLPLAVQSSVVIGDPVETILELGRAERYDLIALGTHGRSGFDRLLVGSVAEKIARRAGCTVLTVRGD